MGQREQLKKEVIQVMKKCQFQATTLCPYIERKYRKLLRLMYRAGLAKIKFSKQEQKILAEQIPSMLFKMDIYVSHITIIFPAGGSYGWSKVERSGLQFLIDQCKKLQSETVQEALHLFDLMGSMLDWDSCLEKVQRTGILELGVEDFDPTNEELEGIPTSHWWFSEARRRNMDYQAATAKKDSSAAPPDHGCRVANGQSAFVKCDQPMLPWSAGHKDRVDKYRHMKKLGMKFCLELLGVCLLAAVFMSAIGSILYANASAISSPLFKDSNLWKQNNGKWKISTPPNEPIEPEFHLLLIVSSIANTLLGFAEEKIATSLFNAASAGEIMDYTIQKAIYIGQICRLLISCLGTTWSLNVIEKATKSECDLLDIGQLAVFCSFCFCSVIKFTTPETMYTKVQLHVINQQFHVMSRSAGKLFKKHVGKLRGKAKLRGNARVIKTLHRVDNIEKLYNTMADPNVNNKKVKMFPYSYEKGVYRGQLNVNNDLIIHPMKLQEVDLTDRQTIFSTSKTCKDSLEHICSLLRKQKLDNQSASERSAVIRKQHFVESQDIYKKSRIRFECTLDLAIRQLCESLSTTSVSNIVIGGRKIFANLSRKEKSMLFTLLHYTLNNDSEVIKIVHEFAIFMECNSFENYICTSEYFACEIALEKNLFKEEFRKRLESGWSLQQVEQHYSISGNWGKRAKSLALQLYTGVGKEEVIKTVHRRYDDLKTEVSMFNEKMKPCGFGSDDLATYHYRKHKHVQGISDKLPHDYPSNAYFTTNYEPAPEFRPPRHTCFDTRGDLTVEDYFKLAESVVKNELHKVISTLSQDGNSKFVTYIDSKTKVKGIGPYMSPKIRCLE